ncbi:MAG: TIGR03013 family XrtA/PEP-CTERM system glycosyltransferase [Gallionella sp.]
MKRFYNQNIFFKVLPFLILAELLTLMGSVYLGIAIRYSGIDYSSRIFENTFPGAILFALVMVFTMSILGMYQYHLKEAIINVFIRLILSLSLGFSILTLIYYLLPDLYLGRGILALVLILSAFGILLIRYAILILIAPKILTSRVIIIGCGNLAKECSELARNAANNHYDIVGFVPMEEEHCYVPIKCVLPVMESLLAVASKYKVDEIIVAMENRRNGNFSITGKFNAYTGLSTRKPIRELLECKLAGINVIEAANYIERELHQIRLDFLKPSWLVFGGGFDQSFLRATTKKIFDVIASLIILIVSLPVMLITAVCILIEDGAPIFYKQLRVGKNGKSFMVLKFRSMQKDAETGGQPQWASSNDPRMTRVGRIIRRLRIDELPQLFNVLKGEMSFVGPRPERPFFVKHLCEQVPYFNLRHSIQPGITGLAQVRYQYGASVDDSIQKLQYDLYYVKNNNLFLDFQIMVETIQVVLSGKGAR